MESSSYFLFVIGLCACVTLLNPISCYGQYLFVFGDSLYDVGNNQYITPDQHIPAYYWPYGMLLDEPTGRFSDGLVVPDFISQYLNIYAPPCLEPGANFTHGASFASAGAGVLDVNPSAMNLPEQFGNFSDMTGKYWTKEELSEGIYLFCIGGDDYFQFIDSHHDGASDAEIEQFVQQVLGNFTIVLQKIYDLGARKFVIQNVAPMGCLPMWRKEYNMPEDECAEFPLTVAKQHNTDLSQALANLSTSLVGFNYTIFDYYSSLNSIIANPLTYGFQVGDAACCGTGLYNADGCGTEPYNLCYYPSGYVFFDGGHHTQNANEELAGLIWIGGKDVIAPYNMKELLGIEDEKLHKLSDQIADE